MEIIKEGNGQNWSLMVKCEKVKDEYGLSYDSEKEHCGSVLKVGKDDIMSRAWEKYLLQVSGIDYVVKCPKCGCCIYIRPDRIPAWVKAKAKNNSWIEKVGIQ